MDNNKIQCQNCGEWIDGEAKFCPNCGAFSKRSFRQDPNKRYCVFCGSEVGPGDNFCPVCGTKIEEGDSKAVDKTPKAEAEPKETIDVKEILATDKWLRELDNQTFGFALTNEVIEEEVVRVGKQ